MDKKSKYCLLASIFLGEWRDLTWLPEGPKFNLHHLREISMVFKMAVITPKSGIQHNFNKALTNNEALVMSFYVSFPKWIKLLKKHRYNRVNLIVHSYIPSINLLLLCPNHYNALPNLIYLTPFLHKLSVSVLQFYEF